MKKILEAALSWIEDVFFERTPLSPIDTTSPFQDLTHHYRKTFSDSSLDAVLVAQPYEAIKYSLERYKYSGEKTLVSSFAQMLVPALGEVASKEKFCIIPVPMHWTHYVHRPFRHIDILAHHVAVGVSLPVLPCLETKTFFRQSKLSRKKRLHNHIGKISVKKTVPNIPESVLLLDDVISTGATAHECAKVLKEHGAKTVIGIFLASNH